MTYSIVARDPQTGQMGVAVQSRYFAVGRIVPWAEAGVGVVATQSFANPGFGPLGLAALRQGRSAAEVLAELVASDPGAAMRQVAVLDAQGRVAVHTGQACVSAAGHELGSQCSAQANMMARDTVWAAMIDAYDNAPGDLACRLLAACRAAEAEGGDLRGRQAAALVVVSGLATGQPWLDRLIDMRVDDHPDPITEIDRQLTYWRCLQRVERATDRALSGDLSGALVDLEASRHQFPHEPEFAFRHGLVLIGLGRRHEAQAVFAQLGATEPGWVELARRFSRAGVIPIDPILLDQLLTTTT